MQQHLHDRPFLLAARPSACARCSISIVLAAEFENRQFLIPGVPGQVGGKRKGFENDHQGWCIACGLLPANY